MAAHTTVIPNNCVSEIKIPKSVKSAFGGDYNPVLDLYATYNYDRVDKRVSVWNPVSGEVVAQFRSPQTMECFGVFHDAVFLPGYRIALSSSEANKWGLIQIFNLGKKVEGEEQDSKLRSAEFVIKGKDLPVTYPGAMALSPRGSLLVTDAFDHRHGVYEIFIDWDNLKVLGSREIIPADQEAEDESGIILLWCSPDFMVITYSDDPPILTSTKLCLNSKGEAEIQEQEKITSYMLNGVEEPIGFDGELGGLVHDGKNLVIANDGDIVLLDSIKEGSSAHLIASSVDPSGQIRLNHEGQLIVFEENVIKLFDYISSPRSLQDLCRSCIRKTIKTSYLENVNSLGIPVMLKNFLLFK